MEEINCACVIHGDKYSWQYVERLQSMLSRNFTPRVNLHVWTEKDRHPPGSVIKHTLTEWPGVHGPKKSWWYKLQMFDPSHDISGPLLYFDLDVVIVSNLDWMLELPLSQFWTVRDFRYLWKSDRYDINSSVMYWDVNAYSWVWQDFLQRDRVQLMHHYPGDQDYLNATIPKNQVGFLDSSKVRSWRWEIKDGGYNYKSRTYQRPDAGSQWGNSDSIIVFHGDPKPHQIHDRLIEQYWY